MRPETDDTTFRPIIRAHELISGYRLVRRLGRGGFADVWEAESPCGEPVALKLVRLSTDLRSGESRALEITRGIRHPSLMMIFDTWQVDNLLVISMELADRSLWDRFHEANDQGLRGIPRPELLGYLRSVADAIDYLNDYRHTIAGQERLGVQHRDLKPQNILLLGDRAKVADFGLARVMEHALASHTGPCTLPYAAPEYFGGKTSRKSDQYALAVTYCQLRGGGMPFFGTVAQIMFGHLCTPPSLEGLPAPERSIVARALAKRPEERWPDCRSFIDALEALGEGQGSPVPDILPRDQRDLDSGPDGEGDSTAPSTSGFVLDSADFDFVSMESFGLEIDGPPGGRLGPDDETPTGESSLETLTRSGPSTPGATVEDRFDPEETGRNLDRNARIRPMRPRLGAVTAASALILVLATLGVSPLPGPLPLGVPPCDMTAAGIARLRPHAGAASGAPERGIGIETTNGTPVATSTSEEVTPELATVSAPGPRGVRVGSATTREKEGESMMASGRSEVPSPEALALTAADSEGPAPEAPVASVGSDVSEPQVPAVTGLGSKEISLGILTSSGRGSAIESPRTPELVAPALMPSPPAADRVRGEDGPTIAVPAGVGVGDLGRPAQPDSLETRTDVRNIILPDAVFVRGGEATRLPIRVLRDDPSEPAHLSYRDLPHGIKVGAPEIIPAGTDSTDAVLSASVEATPGEAEVTVGFTAGSERGEAGMKIVVLPSNASLAFERGRAELARGAYDQAVTAFDEVIRRDSTSFGAHLYRGVANHYRGRYREALSDYTSAIQAQSDSADAYLARARVRIVLGENRLALEDYTRVIQLRGDAKDYLARGCLEHEMGAYDEAMADFDLAARLRPDDPTAHYCRGMTHYVMGDNSLAIRDFSEAIRLNSEHANAYRYRGDAFARMGKYSLAGADRATFERLSRPTGKGILR